MDKKVIKRYPLSKQVADELETMIKNGEYKVGEKINTETELMEIFNVSRNTLREAVKTLTSAGVLEVRQGDGTYVRSNNRFNANMNLKYAETSIDDILEARKALELTTSYFAAQRRTKEDMDKITKAFDKRKASKESVKENTLSDIEFHMEITKACHNQILIDLYESIFSYLESHIAKKIEKSDDDFHIDILHENLYNAILNQKPDTAVMCIQQILQI